MNLTGEGTFDVRREARPPLGGDLAGVARFVVHKTFRGPLTGRGHVEMTSVGAPSAGGAAYVAVERIEGALDGREGSFHLTHLGIMDQGASSLEIRVVPGSGAGALTGLAGTMSIQVEGGVHRYRYDFTLP